MEQTICCVCDKTLSASPKSIGERFFCDVHYAKALASQKMDWRRSGIVEVAAMAAFVALVGSLGGGQQGLLPSHMGIGILLAVIPAVIWMVYIYRLDRVEPEPWPIVLGVFVLGALLAQGLSIPLTNWILGRYDSISSTESLVASMFITGIIQQFCTYIAVRYSVYLTDEFDEPLDGIVYATAAGLGIATLGNTHFVIGSEGLRSLPAAVAVATHSLVHVAACVVMGFGMGRARFKKANRQLWIGGTFALSAIINGGLKQLAVLAGIDGASYQPWLTLSVALVGVIVILIAVDWLSARLSTESFSNSSQSSVESAQT